MSSSVDPATGSPTTPVEVPLTVDNPGDWASLAAKMGAEVGLPTHATREAVTNFVQHAASVLFVADASHNIDLLRSIFEEGVVESYRNLFGQFANATPQAYAVHLISSVPDNNRPDIRILVTISYQRSGADRVSKMFWDLVFDTTLRVAAARCPNCGAAVEAGGLICTYCQHELSTTVAAAVAVSRVQEFL